MRSCLLACLPLLVSFAAGQPQPPADVPGTINISPKPVASDTSVKLDYDIVYVRAPRKGDAVGTNWPEIANPVFMDAGADLMLLHPDGSEEVLVAGRRAARSPTRSSRSTANGSTTRCFHDLKGASARRRGRRPGRTSTRSTSRRGRSCG